MLLGAGAEKKTYIDDVFSTDLWKGDGSTTQTITNGINMSGEGGLTWIKRRTSARNHALFDTVRGAGKRISSNLEAVISTTFTDELKSFTSTGFTVGNSGNTGNNGQDYAAWSFRKSKGFFDCVTYTGNGTTGQYISHNLGCEVGMIIIKCTSAETGWQVYHVSSEITDEHGQGHGADDYELILSGTNTSSQSTQFLSSTAAPTASNFHLNKDSWLNNKNGESYVAYIFAAGRSTASTARCVQFDGSNDELTIDDHADFELGNGDFTIETWIKGNQAMNSYITAVAKWKDSGNNRSWNIRYSSQDIVHGKWVFFYSLDGSSYSGTDGGTVQGGIISDGKWHHIAVTRTGGNIRTFTDGVLNSTVSESGTFYDGDGDVTIGGQGANYFRGHISNLRLVKGTALYTSNFTPPTEPLTNVTNTKLLCCNNIATTGSTVTPGTISKNSYPYPIPESPFKDSAAQKFGDSKGNIIHCGSYIGGGNTDRNIDLGWEPQWLLIKDTTTASNWILHDNLRGLTGKDVGDKTFYTNTDDAEQDDTYYDIEPWGFRITSNTNEVNKDYGRFVFVAIRRPDPLVQKPADAGTDVFHMVTGAATTPSFPTGFETDLALIRRPETSQGWWAYSRLLQGKYLDTINQNAEQTDSNGNFDYNNGFYDDTSLSDFQAWAWKRHAGFDQVTIDSYDSGFGPTYTWHDHSLGKKPEMIWVKRRDDSQEWWVYHHGANGGTNPWDRFLQLHSDSAEGSLTGFFGESGPTATQFSFKRGAMTDGHFIINLFASVDGISKVGSYSGSSSTVTVTTGFQPRFVMFKRINSTGSWFVLDTIRGWGSGNDKYMPLNANNVQADYDFGAPTSTGFTVNSGDNESNNAGNTYIYYAHA